MTTEQTVAALKDVRKSGVTQKDYASNLESRLLIEWTGGELGRYRVTDRGEAVLRAARIKGRLDTLPPTPPYQEPGDA